MPVTYDAASDSRARWFAVGAGALYFVGCTGASWLRWANFEYRTFDLAYYFQALWQLIHGRFAVTVEHVPLLGNHVEPIVFLIAPVFAVLQHPMIFVAIQNAALAAMAPVAFNLARRLGLSPGAATLLATAILLTPAAGYIAVHEFHPEALAAPLVLLMLRARAAGSVPQHSLWLVAAMACKENIALLVISYCLVNLVLERQRGMRELRGWYVWPLLGAMAWFLVCTRIITPALNSGSIDYFALYSRLGDSPGAILQNAFREPHRIIGALNHALTNGNLIPALLLPFLALPVLRLRWLIIGAPIILQHMLSWRPVEWSIYLHYAAPLLPLVWLAMAEAVAHIHSREILPFRVRRSIPVLVLIACFVAQSRLGPAQEIASDVIRWPGKQAERQRKQALLSSIPAGASVMAPLPYLSHLAKREELYSLHYVLKGLKTLSRATYEPPLPTDFVLLDYGDESTFDSDAGFYHPAMKTEDGRIISSSDQLLRKFLAPSAWSATSRNALTLLRREQSALEHTASAGRMLAQLKDGSQLRSISISTEPAHGSRSMQVTLDWTLAPERDPIPWMYLKLTPKAGGEPVYLNKGLCAPEAGAGAYQEKWRLDAPAQLAEGDFVVEAVLLDNCKRSWLRRTDPGAAFDATAVAPPISLGELRLRAGNLTFAPH